MAELIVQDLVRAFDAFRAVDEERWIGDES